MGKKRRRLIREAEKMLKLVPLTTANPKPGEWIKKFGKNYPLDEFTAEHFDHYHDAKKYLKKYESK